MGKNHLSTLAAPKGWFLGRKKYGKWIVRASPGPHALKNCLPAALVLKSLLRYAKTAKEVRKILSDGNIFIDKVLRKKYDFPIGLMDVIDIKPTRESFRVVVGRKGELKLVPVSDSDKKLLKVVGKTLVKKGRIQVNFHDGRNLLMDKFDGSVGDSIVFDLKGRKLVRRISLEKGNLALIDGGRYVGFVGRIKDVIKGDAFKKALIVFDVGGKEYTTLKDYAFAVGEKNSEVMLEGGK